MPKLRKMRRKQKFQYNVNRRALNRKSKKLPTISNEIVKKAWDDKKSLDNNLTLMGLVADPNKSIPVHSVSKKGKVTIAKAKPEEKPEMKKYILENPHKRKVVGELEASAKKAKLAKKDIVHPLPPEMVKKLIRFLDKFGEDYEAMSKYHLNYYQETPAQLKKQVERFKNIPQQYIPYLKERNLLVKQEDKKEDS